MTAVTTIDWYYPQHLLRAGHTFSLHLHVVYLQVV